MEKAENEVAPAGDKLGYAFTLIQDFGSGRQLQISFGLKPGAPKEAIDTELDKLRLAVDRQRAYGVIRDTETKLGAERKMLEAIEGMIADSEASSNQVLADMKDNKNSPTVEKQQRLNMVAQAQAFRQSKALEKREHQTNIAIGESVLAGAKKEIGE